MVSFLSFVTLALAGMVVGFPLQRALSLVASLSADAASINSISLVSSIENTVSSCELGVESNSDTRARVACSDCSQASFIAASHYEAKILATSAIDYINTYGITDELFISYFGVTNSSSTQLDVFSQVANEYSLTLTCTDPYSICENAINAYSIPSLATIFYCPPFYDQLTISGLCSRATVDLDSIRSGTSLRTLLLGLATLGGGCSYARDLALANSSMANDNANNYSCFAMQVFADTHC